jgi:hypothetical protein
MDHLPLPRGVASSSFDVPFVAMVDYDQEESSTLSERDYDRQEFSTFPYRQDFQFDEFTSAGEAASFIQSWLYFGLLEAILKKPLDRSTFLVRYEGRPGNFVSSRALACIDLQFLPLQDSEEDDDDDLPHGGEDMERIFHLVEFAEQKGIDLDKTYKSAPDPLPVILLSIRVLVETLYVVFLGVLKHGEWHRMIWQLPDTKSAATTRLISRTMLNNGWCPFQIRSALELRTPLVCYVAQMHRHQPPRIMHANCAEESGCIAFNVSNGKYETRHVMDGCSCKPVPIPVFEMRRIIHDGGIPLAFTKRDKKTGKISLGIKAATSADLYVAFSHVWADGLGNEDANALPVCRLEQLETHLDNCSRLTQSIGSGHYFSFDFIRMSYSYHTKLFWLDTLCIPRAVPRDLRGEDYDEDEDSKEVKELKQIAINNITPTFAGASRVIILDAEIKNNFQLKDSEWTEVALRLIFSNWMGRCWTLEEGALSRTAQLQCIDTAFDPNAICEDRSRWEYVSRKPTFGGMTIGAAWEGLNVARRAFSRRCFPGDGAVEPTEYTRRFERRIRRMLNVPLESMLEYCFQQKRYDLDYEDESPDQIMRHFKTCWNDLSTRSTSRTKDRLVVLSNLMQVNASAVSRTTLPMMALLRSLPGVPLAVLYYPGPKVEEKNVPDKDVTLGPDDYNRWLPAYPTTFRLESDAWMEWSDDYLELASNPKHTNLFLIDDHILTNVDKTEFLVQEGRQKYRYRVELLRQGKRCLPNAGIIASCLVVDRDDYRKDIEGAHELRGACLQVLDKVEGRPGNRGHKLINAVYDCPVRVSRTALQFSGGNASESPWLPVQRWSLKLRHGEYLAHCNTTNGVGHMAHIIFARIISLLQRLSEICASAAPPQNLRIRCLIWRDTARLDFPLWHRRSHLTVHFRHYNYQVLHRPTLGGERRGGALVFPSVHKFHGYAAILGCYRCSCHGSLRLREDELRWSSLYAGPLVRRPFVGRAHGYHHCIFFS